MIFTKTLQKMSKQGLIIQIINYRDHYQKKKEKENIGVMKDKLSEKIMREFVGLKQNDC